MKFRKGLVFALSLNALGAASAQQEESQPAANRPFQRDVRRIEEASPLVMSFGAVADKVLPSTVLIRIPGSPGGRDGGPLAAGSGVVISAEGHILTTSRVVGDARTVEVGLSGADGMRTVIGHVLAADPAVDIAVVKVDGLRLQPAILGDSDQVKAGAAAYVAEPGRAFVKARVTSTGGGTAGRDFIQTDVAVRATNAGSPLADGAGRVIGLNVPALRSEMTGLAIAINGAIPLLDNLGTETAAPVPGPRAFLGVQIADLPPTPAPPGVPNPPRGAVVQMVGAGSPAERAGVEVGDVIVAIDNQPVAEGARLRQIISARVPGDEIAIEVLRGGRQIQARVVLTELPTVAAAGAVPPPIPQMPPAAVAPSVTDAVPPPSVPAPIPADVPPAEMLTGLTAVALTPQMRARHGVPADIQGVLVTYLSPTSRALSMGIQEGDVIMQVNRKPVTMPAEARELALQGDKTVLLKLYRKGDTMVFMVGRE